MHRLGVVSFLNARPLVEGLDRADDVEIVYDVPALLPGRLAREEVDAALVPIVDVLRNSTRLRVLSDACIACDGETMTVRVFSQAPPDRVRMLWADTDSHTSVALAAVIWRELFGQELSIRPLDARREDVDSREAVLLIGDKVVDQRRGSFAYEVDLGGAWRQHTGLPFVFAVWATRTEFPHSGLLESLLSTARDRGVARAETIAMEQGPPLGWPVELARRYLTRCLRFQMDARYVEGANLFGRLCAAAGVTPAAAQIRWPDALASMAGPVA